MAHPQQFLLNPQHWFPPPQQFPPADFQQELAKAAALRSNSNHLAIPVRLANSSQADHTNSTTVVRSLVKRFDLEGKLVTVAENVRKWMEEDNPEWLVQIGRRVGAGYITKDGKASFLLLYGDGYETLLLLDGIDPPQDLSKVPTIGISASFAPAVGDMDQDTAAKQGLLEPSDSLWEHVNFEFNRQGNDRSLVIHTSSRVSMRSYDDLHRKRVIRVWTVGPHRSALGRIERDTMLENQWKLGWRGSITAAKLPAATAGVPEAVRALPLPAKQAPIIKAVATKPRPPAAKKPAPIPPVANGRTAAPPTVAPAAAAAPKPTDTNEDEANPTILAFKPREIVLLERAFEDSLTDDDLKTNCELWGDDDFKAAFNICKTLELRWTGIDVEKKRKSEGGSEVPAKKPRGRPKAATQTKAATPATTAVEASKNTNGASAPTEAVPKEVAAPPVVKTPNIEADKPKEVEKVKEEEKAKDAGKPKEAEKETDAEKTKEAKKQKETEKSSKSKETPVKAKPAPKPKKSEAKVKTESSSDEQPKESPAKKPATPATRTTPDKNISSTSKDEKDKESNKQRKSPGRPKGSKNKSKDDEKKTAVKAKTTKSKPLKTSAKASEGGK